MKERLRTWFGAFRRAVRLHPAEVFLALLFGWLGCEYYEFRAEGWKVVLRYAPVLFLITYTLNRLTAGKGSSRIVYFLSAGLFLVLPYWVGGEWSVRYMVSLVVVQLAYLISGWQRDNRLFMETALRYVGAWLAAGALALVAWGLSISIYYSIWAIFEIEGSQESRFFAYASSIVFGTLAPLLFLVFDGGRKKEFAGGKVFEMLLNFVLSPALLVYAVILYVYFFKIVVVWSLPKGAVAYIVVSFVSAAFLLKGCQAFLSRRLYDWFYDRVSWVVLPALAMYWIGAVYRIGEYGFTELRVYLVVVGVILTVAALLFFSRKTGRYVYVACLAAVLLADVTYIPGWKASDIERISQAGRLSGEGGRADVTQTEYFDVSLEGPVDIGGFRTLELADNYLTEEGIRVYLERDMLFITRKDKDTLLVCPADSFWNGQLCKAGVSKGALIPQSAERALLEVDLEEGRLILRRINLMRTIAGKDTVDQILYLDGAYLLKP